MGFIKVRGRKARQDAIINTDLICRITKVRGGYLVSFSCGNVGDSYDEYDEENAKKIFQEIGVSL